MIGGVNALLLRSFVKWLFKGGITMKVTRTDLASNPKDPVVMDLDEASVSNLTSLYMASPEYSLLTLLKKVPRTKKDCMLCGERATDNGLPVSEVGMVHPECLEKAIKIAPEHPITLLILKFTKKR